LAASAGEFVVARRLVGVASRGFLGARGTSSGSSVECERRGPERQVPLPPGGPQVMK